MTASCRLPLLTAADSPLLIPKAMLVRDFDFDLPPDLIAQAPIYPRDAARLLRLQRESGALSHHVFSDLPQLLRADDLLVFNDTRVLRARLRGHKIADNGQNGARVEALLLREKERNLWEVLLRPSARLKTGTTLVFSSPDGTVQVQAAPVERLEERWMLQFFLHNGGDVRAFLPQLGEVPLPPYISARTSTEDDYQTVYARQHSANFASSTRLAEPRSPEMSSRETPALESAAAPTAGLHFTPQLLERLRERGLQSCFVTLGIGIGTFRPMQSEHVEEHAMHREQYEISGETAQKINEQKARGGRIVAVGTTTVRVLESAFRENGAVGSGWNETEIFLRPGCRFRVVDALITNFHLPRSTLLVMIAAFAQQKTPDGLASVRAAYDEAVRQRYRFFSFGDAMLIE